MRRTVFGSSHTKRETRLAAMLCYLLWIMGGILLLTIERESRFVRFHALQSILYSSAVAIALVATALLELYWLCGALFGVAVAGSLILTYRAARGDWFELPGIGWLAERSA